MTKFRIIFYLIFIFSLSQDIYSQEPVKRSSKTLTIFGNQFYIHIIKKNETLFAISKAYNVSEKEISIANPDLFNGIVVGQVLKIPIIQGQNANDEEIDIGEKFTYIKVGKGLTLYSLSKKYKLTESEIIYYNPQVKYGLKTGQVLKIPGFSVSFQSEDESFIYHKVKKKQTLFSLAQRYDVSIEKIIKYNTELKNGLKEGKVIRIPKSQFTITDTLLIEYPPVDIVQNIKNSPLFFRDKSCVECDKFVYNKDKTFKIAIFLPLYIEHNYNRSFSKEMKFYNGSKRFIEFYEGILLAINAMKAKGISVELNVYDTEKSRSKVKEILNRKELLSVDLIIGPVYFDNIKLVSNFAKKHRINIVSPLSQNNELLKYNPFVFQVIPSQAVRVERTSHFLAKMYDKSIVLVHNGTFTEKKLIDTYKLKLVKSFSFYNNIEKIVFKQINYKVNGISGVEDALSVGLENIVIIPSTDEVFVSSIIDKLKTLSKNYKIHLYGMSTWERFRNIDLTHIQKLDIHYSSVAYINYKNWWVKNFIKKYREAYEYEPSAYSFLGYDVLTYFVSVMKEYGKYFQFCIDKKNSKIKNIGLRNEFKFKRISRYGGFENNGVFILKYDDKFNLKKLSK